MQKTDIDMTVFRDRKVFLSYTKRDQHQVHGLSCLLFNLGSEVNMMGNFPTGPWAPSIYKYLGESDFLLIYISKAPAQSKAAIWTTRIIDWVSTKWNRLVRKRAWPKDGVREEFEYFRNVHKSEEKIVIFAEDDADKPAYLRHLEFTPFATQLTKIRKTWADLKRQGVSSDERRRIILTELKCYGVDLEDKDLRRFMDFFGIHSILSGMRFAWRRTYEVLSKFIFVGAPIGALALSFAFGFDLKGDKIVSPEFTGVPIKVGQSGRLACEKSELVCVSVSQSEGRYGNSEKSDILGFYTPTCESLLKTSSTCKKTWGLEYAITDVFIQKFPDSPVKQGFSKIDFCQAEPVYTFANCVAPNRTLFK